MSAYEGTNLLIACMTSIPPAECPAALDAFRPLAPRPTPTFAFGCEFTVARTAQTFWDALDALLTILPGMSSVRLELTMRGPPPTWPSAG